MCLESQLGRDVACERFFHLEGCFALSKPYPVRYSEHVSVDSDGSFAEHKA